MVNLKKLIESFKGRYLVDVDLGLSASNSSLASYLASPDEIPSSSSSLSSRPQQQELPGPAAAQSPGLSSSPSIYLSIHPSTRLDPGLLQ